MLARKTNPRRPQNLGPVCRQHLARTRRQTPVQAGLYHASDSSAGMVNSSVMARRCAGTLGSMVVPGWGYRQQPLRAGHDAERRADRLVRHVCGRGARLGFFRPTARSNRRHQRSQGKIFDAKMAQQSFAGGLPHCSELDGTNFFLEQRDRVLNLDDYSGHWTIWSCSASSIPRPSSRGIRRTPMRAGRRSSSSR